MKIYAFIFILSVYFADGRKTYMPINKNANIDFINMEAGGQKAPNTNRPAPVSAPVGIPGPAPVPAPAPTVAPAKPTVPTPAPQPKNPQPITGAPVVTNKPAPTKVPTLITPKPVNPTPAVNPITTPGPGSVKQLITFYDSQGKASHIRPYSYSQAVKQG